MFAQPSEHIGAPTSIHSSDYSEHISNGRQPAVLIRHPGDSDSIAICSLLHLHHPLLRIWKAVRRYIPHPPPNLLGSCNGRWIATSRDATGEIGEKRWTAPAVTVYTGEVHHRISSQKVNMPQRAQASQVLSTLHGTIGKW